jgi:hypothetical protein
MTTSGVTVYEITRNQIIEAAMRKCGRLAKGQSADSTDLANGMLALNGVIAARQTMGMPLWARQDYSVTLVAGQRDYTIGDGQTIDTPFPLKMQKVVLETVTGGSMREIFPTAYQDFRLLNTESTGVPVSYTYQPKINLGVLSVWPLPDSTSASAYSLKLTYQRPFEGFSAAGETPDFPQEWQLALIYSLAVTLAPEYGVPLEDRKMLQMEAKVYTDSAAQGGAEEASIYFKPDRTRGR